MRNSTFYAVSLLATTALLVTGCKELGGGHGGSSDSLRIEVPVEAGPSPDASWCQDEEQFFGLQWAQVYPQDGRDDVATGAYILARFTHEPDAQSLHNATFGLETTAEPQEAVALTPTVNGQDVSFQPAEPHLLANTGYRFYMEANGESGIAAAECEGSASGSKYLVFLDEAGEPLVDENGDPVTEQENQFTTGEDNYLEIAYTMPQNGDDGVALNVEPVVVFNQPIDTNSLVCGGEGANVTLKREPKSPLVETQYEQLNCEVTEDGTKVTVTPAEPLKPSSTYELVIDSEGVAAADEEADPMDDREVVTFETLANLAVVSTTPEAGAQNVLPSITPAVEFNQPVVMGDECAINLVKLDADGVETPVAGECELSEEGNEIQFNPNDPLDEGDYRLVVDADRVTAEADDSMALDSPIELEFNVGDGSLAVVHTDPEDGDQDVSADVAPVITFNQPVEFDQCPLTLNALDADGNGEVVNGSCEREGDDTIRFIPESPLAEGRHHEITVASNDVKPADENADPMASDATIAFRINGEGPIDVVNCASNVSGLCILGGEGNNEGLVDLLLDDENGPLAPLAGQIGGKEKLANALETLLENDDGELTTLLENLFLEGNLQKGLEQLLISDQGLQSILPELLMGDDEGNAGLEELLAGEDGARGLLEALLIPADESSGECASALGNVCLVAPEGGDKKGVLDLLLGDDSELGSQGLSTQALVDALSTTLGENPDLGQTVAGLFMDGNLQAGLEELFLGDDEKGPALLTTLENLGTGIVEGLCNVLGGLLGLGTCS